MTPLPSPSSFWGPKGVGCVVLTFTCTTEGPSCSTICGTEFSVAFSEGAEDVVCSSVLRPAALWSCDELLLVPQLVASAPVRRRIKRETSKTTRRCFSGGDFMAFVSFLFSISVQSFHTTRKSGMRLRGRRAAVPSAKCRSSLSNKRSAIHVYLYPP